MAAGPLAFDSLPDNPRRREGRATGTGVGVRTRDSGDRRGGVERAEEGAAGLADGSGGLEAGGGRGDAVERLEGDVLAQRQADRGRSDAHLSDKLSVRGLARYHYDTMVRGIMRLSCTRMRAPRGWRANPESGEA